MQEIQEPLTTIVIVTTTCSRRRAQRSHGVLHGPARFRERPPDRLARGGSTTPTRSSATRATPVPRTRLGPLRLAPARHQRFTRRTAGGPLDVSTAASVPGSWGQGWCPRPEGQLCARPLPPRARAACSRSRCSSPPRCPPLPCPPPRVPRPGARREPPARKGRAARRDLGPARPRGAQLGGAPINGVTPALRRPAGSRGVSGRCATERHYLALADNGYGS